MIESDLEKVIQAIEMPVCLSFDKVIPGEYDFVLQGKSRLWNIKVSFPEQFPYCLPSAKLLDTDLIGTLAHVNKNGTICLEEGDSVLVDYTRPLDIVCLFLNQIVSLLERMKLGIYQDELLDEFEGYFLPRKKINSFYYAQNKLEWIYLRQGNWNKNGQPKYIVPLFISDRNVSTPPQFSNIKNLGAFQRSKILHIPLDQSILPPANGENITSTYITAAKQHIDEKNRKALTKHLKKTSPHKLFFILLSMPRSSGERSQLLLRFDAEKSLPHPLLENNEEWSITPYSVKRHNKEYLLERGGAEKYLLDNKVAIIGCGSVGGEITTMLAKAGIGELTLVDHDILDADNIYRHRLGGSYLNFLPSEKTGAINAWKKVDALAAMLKQDLPHITVNSKPLLFEQVINDPDIINADVIVIAIGSPSVSLIINQTLKALGHQNVIYCWNEAAGCGGHSVAVNLNHSCLECLYEKDGRISAVNEISLVEPGQDISKNITGCAGVFTPFSYLDSSRTAEAAAQQAIDMLISNKHSVIMSWKGDNAHNLRVTERYENMPLKQEMNLSKNDQCRVCHG